jgi:exonuclease III
MLQQLLKQARRPYHLDYLFLPQAWLSRLKTLQVGAADAWLAYSDHVPVVADVQL